MLNRLKKFIYGANETGRSMVEMLGVLVIIGVLSVGAISGYDYAMTKYRADTILNEITTRYTVALQQSTLGDPIHLDEFNGTVLGNYKIEVYEPEDMDGVIAFELTNIPGKVAKQLLSSDIPTLKKRNVVWVWLAVSRDTQEILGHYVGTRELDSFNAFYNTIEHIETTRYASDYWKPYGWLPENKHLWGKAHAHTVERTNRMIRYYLARLVRRTHCFSKSVQMLDESLLLFRYRN